MPISIATSMASQLSVANLSGGTTKQFDWLRKGRARHSASLPAMACSKGAQSRTWSACTKLDPMCFVVPAAAA
jgi:hypothetical protein